MVVNLRGHRRKGGMDNVNFLCLFLCRSHENSFGSSFALQTTFFIILVEGESFQLFLQNKIRFCFNFVVIAEDSDFFAAFL